MAHSKIPGYADLWVNSLMIGNTGFIITEDELGTFLDQSQNAVQVGAAPSTRRRCEMTSVQLIRTEDDYRAALARAEELMTAEAGTSEGDELEHLAMVIEAYEEKHHPIELPDPIAAIQFRMEQEGLTNKDLAPYFGSSGKVSEVLSGKHTGPLDIGVVDGTSTAADLYLNWSGTAATIDATSTITVTGTITVAGRMMGDD